MKSTPLIFQDFSIVGLRKQWEKQQYFSLEKPCLRGNERECNLHNTSCENCYDNYKRWVDANRPGFIGAKTETRRTRGLDKINENPNEWEFKGFGDTTSSRVFKFPLSAETSYAAFRNKITGEFEPSLIKPPYGVVGDEIWVKESYGYTQFQLDKGLFGAVEIGIPESVIYKADGNEDWDGEWKNPLFMPKTVCRIKLKIAGISIERLHDITEEGAIREGIYQIESGMWLSNGGKSIKDTCRGSDAVYAYKMMWYLLHGKESWDKSPWVWVIRFTVKEFKQ